MAVSVRNEYIIADDCRTNTTSKFSIGADYGEIFGFAAEAKCSAYNGDGDNIPWMVPWHEWDCQAGLISKYDDYSIGNRDYAPHFTLSVGGSVYLFVGADISLSFDVDEFLKRMGCL